MLLRSLLLFSIVVSVKAALLFNYKAITNGGGNRFWVTDQCDYWYAGADVSGRVKNANFLDWFNDAAKLYNTLDTTNCGISGMPGTVTAQSNGIAKISGNNVGGSCKWQFVDQGEASNFVDFLKAFFDSDAFDTCVLAT